jgi:hypothetical protein
VKGFIRMATVASVVVMTTMDTRDDFLMWENDGTPDGRFRIVGSRGSLVPDSVTTFSQIRRHVSYENQEQSRARVNEALPRSTM